MATFEPKPGQGTLFKADKKSENSPDFTGSIVAHRDIKAGEVIRLAAWSKSGAKGWYYSLKGSDSRPAADKPATTPDEADSDRSPF